MTKEEKTVAAVNAFNMGEEVLSIVSRFKCSKIWLYKWVNPYKANPTGGW